MNFVFQAGSRAFSSKAFGCTRVENGARASKIQPAFTNNFSSYYGNNKKRRIRLRFAKAFATANSVRIMECAPREAPALANAPVKLNSPEAPWKIPCES